MGIVEDLLRRGPLGELLAGRAENGVSQSSASQAVHQLELRLGVKLIDRSKRPLVLTPHGQGLLRGMQGRWSGGTWSWRTGSRRWRTTHNVVGTVRVASIYSVGPAPHEQYRPDVRRALPGGERPAGVPAPDAGRRECHRAARPSSGLISFPRKWPELKVIPWREEEMVLAVHPSHRFAGPGAVDVARARRRDVRRLRCRPVDPPGHRPVPAAPRGPGQGGTRVRQHREHQARRGDPVGGRDPAARRRWRARWRRGRWSRSGSTARTPIIG